MCWNHGQLGPFWVEGTIGRNYLGGASMTKEEKVDTAVTAFVDVHAMSEADILVGTSSKFPKAADYPSMCP